jgi:serine/threonine protein kinase
MQRFSPKANDTLRLELDVGDLTFRFVPHPDPRLLTARVPHSMSGEKSNIWRLEDLSPGGGEYALKVMTHKHRLPCLPIVCNYLHGLRSVVGLQCCDRICLTRENCLTLETYPELEFSILMPWMKGPSWFDAHQDHGSTRTISRWEALQLAQLLAEILTNLEVRNLAHCALSPYNLIVDAGSGHLHIELVGVEDLYSPDLPEDGRKRAGFLGYRHRSFADDSWSGTSDRFSGGLLIAEILGWHHPAVRGGLYSAEYYFDPEELQVHGSEQYRVLESAVGEHHRDLAALLRTVWESPTEKDCPPFRDWLSAIQMVAHTKIAYTWLVGNQRTLPSKDEPRCWDRPGSSAWNAGRMRGCEPPGATAPGNNR